MPDGGGSAFAVKDIFRRCPWQPAAAPDYAADCSAVWAIARCGVSLPRLTSSGATSTRLRPRALAR